MEMKLTAGNYINQGEQYGIKPCSAYELYQYSLYCKGAKVAFYYAEWRPIPLTEEWALRFGVPESSLNMSFDLPNNIKLWVDMSNDNNHIWHLIFKGIYFDVDFVHTLQNLVHSLTGEDLTIK